ncbi:MAG: hypothetical protein HZA01_12730 [Nitrospinae bacterium]|nr:hypothetical protein [Nitrospinota bacterium]
MDKRNNVKGMVSLVLGAVLFFAASNKGEAYNITQKKTSDPKGILWNKIVDGSVASAGTCATNATCHTKSSNKSKGILKNLQLKDGRKKFVKYSPGKTYNLAISVPKPGNINGFQMSARDPNGNSAGKFIKGKFSLAYYDTDSDTRKKIQLIENTHNNKTKVSSWSFKWTAPAVGTGTVTFYYGLIAGNGDAISTNDAAYYGVVKISEM